MIEWLTTNLGFERGTPKEFDRRNLPAAGAIPMPPETGPGGRRRRSDGRPFLRALDIDHLYAAAEAAGAVTAHDPLETDLVRRPVVA